MRVWCKKYGHVIVLEALGHAPCKPTTGTADEYRFLIFIPDLFEFIGQLFGEFRWAPQNSYNNNIKCIPQPLLEGCNVILICNTAGQVYGINRSGENGKFGVQAFSRLLCKFSHFKSQIFTCIYYTYATPPPSVTIKTLFPSTRS